MADLKITGLDDIIDRVELVEKSSKTGFHYHTIRLVIGDDNIDMLAPDFSTPKLLKQELELAKLRAK